MGKFVLTLVSKSYQIQIYFKDYIMVPSFKRLYLQLSVKNNSNLFVKSHMTLHFTFCFLCSAVLTAVVAQTKTKALQ